MKNREVKVSESIESSVVFNPDHKVIQLLNSGTFKVIGLGFVKGQVLEKHSTTSPAFLFVHTGAVEFLINGEVMTLKQGSYYKIPENIEHEVKAIEDSRLLLIK